MICLVRVKNEIVGGNERGSFVLVLRKLLFQGHVTRPRFSFLELGSFVKFLSFEFII